MKINQAYKTALDPNNVQRTLFLRAAGCARWAYNWGLKRKIESFEARKAAMAAGVIKADLPKVPTAIDLHRELVLLKNLPVEQGGVPWMWDSSKSAPQEALRNLDKAFDSYFRKCKSGKAGPKGFPRFKSRKQGIGGFRLEGYATQTHAHLPRIGKVKLKERGYLPTKDTAGVHVLGTAVSEKAGKWFVSLQVEQEIPDPLDRSHLPVIGVDVGIKTLATCSDGRVFENPKALKAGTARLRMLQKSVSRKLKGSNNRRKAQAKVSLQHYRVSCIREDALHKASNSITKKASLIVLEDLNVSGMLKNHKLAKSILDSSMSELHRQIRYKAEWQGVPVKTADRWFPSSKTCSTCGFIKVKLSLSEREFVCDQCGQVIDRDLNAAINLKNLVNNLAGSSPVTACCPGSSGLNSNAQTKLLVGQELNSNRMGGVAWATQYPTLQKFWRTVSDAPPRSPLCCTGMYGTQSADGP